MKGLHWVAVLCFCWLIVQLAGCASYASFQTAQTTSNGELSATGGIGYHEEGEEPHLNLSMRYGLADSVDIGVVYNQTQNGSTLVMADVKLSVKSNSPGFHHAVGFGVSPIFNEYEGLAFHAPYFASFYTPHERLAVYLNPRLIYYIDMRDNPENSNTGLGFGTSVGLKIGKKFSVLPEWSFLAGQFDNRFEVNNLLSIGFGINVY